MTVLRAGATCAGASGTCAELRLEGLGLAYGARWAFRGVDLIVPACRISVLVGPSGCGKSSLLSTLNRLDELQDARCEGRVLLGKQDIRAEPDPVLVRRRIGMIFQRPTPFPLSVRANIEVPLCEHGVRPAHAREERIETTLRAVGLWDEVRDRLDAPAQQLSGGQQQRLCLARALALQPEVLLLDEPCSALDLRAAGHIEDLILSLRGFYTIVLVTHDLAQARRVADRLALLWPGADGGRLVGVGGADLGLAEPLPDASATAYLRGERVAVAGLARTAMKSGV